MVWGFSKVSLRGSAARRRPRFSPASSFPLQDFAMSGIRIGFLHTQNQDLVKVLATLGNFHAIPGSVQHQAAQLLRSRGPSAAGEPRPPPGHCSLRAGAVDDRLNEGLRDEAEAEL